MITIDLILIYFGTFVEIIVSFSTVIASSIVIFSILSLFITVLMSIFDLIKADYGVK